MGAEPWDYYVPYQANLQTALDELRQQEFAAGRFNSADDHPQTIEEAIEFCDADGTGSILDMETVSQTPDYCVVTPMSDERLIEFFGTTQPTRDMVEDCWDFYDDIERGHGVSITIYKDGKPDEIHFVGYSFD